MCYPPNNMDYLALLAASGGHKAPPLIDVDGTVFVQFAIFMVLLFVLNTFVFKPYLAMRRDQEDSIEGAKARATSEQDNASEMLAGYEAKLLSARKEAAAERLVVRADGESKAQKTLAIARKSAEKQVVDAREKLEKVAPAARLALRTRADQLAKVVAAKVLGRAIN